jgi:signal transduction histidine kinase
MTVKTNMMARLCAGQFAAALQLTFIGRWMLTAIITCCSLAAFAQSADSGAVDVARIRFTKHIYDQCWFYAAPKGSTSPEQFPAYPYIRSARHMLRLMDVPDTLMERDNLLKFIVYNSSDSVEEICVSPGMYCNVIELYKAEQEGNTTRLQLVPDSISRKVKYNGVRMIRVMPGETAVYYCRFNFVRTNVNNFIPRLIEKDYVWQWVAQLRDNDRLLDIFTYVVSGVMLLMVFYSLAVFLQSRNREFIFYAIYTFCTASLLFLKSYFNLTANAFNYFYEEYLDFMIMSGSVFSYLFFVRRFVDTRKNYPSLDKFLRLADWMLLVLCAVYSMIYFLTDRYGILNIMENLVIKIFFFLIGVVFILYSIKRKDPLLNYLVAGNFVLIVFSVMSQAIIQFHWQLVEPDTSIFNRALFYYESGLVLELGFFLSGLAYKNRRDIIERVKERERLKLENERKEFEKQVAVLAAQQQERDRISADMHDELGSGMTAIRLMSEILKHKMKDQHFPELEKISSSANDLLSKMNTIIWTMKSSNDTLESLVAYIRAHATEYFDNTPIECKVNVPAVIPQVDISGEKRRNIFLSVKEALNNAMKHSQGTQIRIDIITLDNKLIIKVADNGVGINPEQLRRFGNGLSNMRRRMESINGSCKIEGEGSCVVTFEAPIG